MDEGPYTVVKVDILTLCLLTLHPESGSFLSKFEVTNLRVVVAARLMKKKCSGMTLAIMNEDLQMDSER